MSRRCVGYEGEGRARRPVYEDQGPANGRGNSESVRAGIAIARLSDQATTREAHGGAAATVERRMATEAQRAHWHAPPAQDSPIAPVSVAARPALNSPEHLQASRMRGAVRRLEVVNARRPSPAPLPEEQPMATDPSPPPEELSSDHSSLQAVADAAAHAAAARAALEGAIQESRVADRALAEAEVAWDNARAALESSWRATGIGATPPPSPADEVLKREAEPADDAPEVVTRPATNGTAAMAAFAADRAERASGEAGLTSTQERVLAALRTANGNLSAAAIALGTSAQSVGTTLRHIGEKGGIPIDMIPSLPAAYAKYRPAAG